MYAVSRVGTARTEKYMEAATFVAETGEMLRGEYGFEVRTSTEEIGPMGRFAFTSRWSSLEDLVENRHRLMQESAYLDRMRQGGELFLPGMTDHVFMTLDGSAMPDPSAFTSARFGVARNGRLREAGEFAAHIAADVSANIGVHIVPVMRRGGRAGTFAFMTGHDSIADWEASFVRFAADETSAKAIDEAGELWLDGSIRDQLWRSLD